MKNYVPMFLEDMWNKSMDSYAYYSKQNNTLLAEIYSKNADKIFKAQFLISEAINKAAA